MYSMHVYDVCINNIIKYKNKCINKYINKWNRKVEYNAHMYVYCMRYPAYDVYVQCMRNPVHDVCVQFIRYPVYVQCIRNPVHELTMWVVDRDIQRACGDASSNRVRCAGVRNGCAHHSGNASVLHPSAGPIATPHVYTSTRSPYRTWMSWVYVNSSLICVLHAQYIAHWRIIMQ